MSGTNRKSFTRWNDEEWFIIARHLYQANLLTLEPNQDMKHLKSGHIRKAAKDITNPDRRREDVFLNMPNVRAGLDRAVRIFKNQLEGSSLRVVDEPEDPAPVVRVGAEENTILTMIAGKVVDQLADPLLEKLKFFMAETMINYGMIRTGVTADEIVRGPIAPPPKRLKVGLVGLLPIQAESFKTQFRDIDFVHVDGNGARKDIITKMANQDLVIILTSKVNHGPAEAIIAEFKRQNRKDDVKRCHGGPTEMARTLRIWLSSKGEA